jgi:hypothetical protein
MAFGALALILVFFGCAMLLFGPPMLALFSFIAAAFFSFAGNHKRKDGT